MRDSQGAPAGRRRLPKEDRRRQLLAMALRIVREEGTDRLTLGHLAARAGVSKPVAYDHFGTRSALLIELYKSIDGEHVVALHDALQVGGRGLDETAGILARAYIRCGADTHGDWRAVAAALAGSPEKEAAHREVLSGYVRMFAAALAPHCDLASPDLERRCVGLVAAGEALVAAMLSGGCGEPDAVEAFTALIRGGLRDDPR